MNDLRIAIVGFLAVVVGFAGAWWLFGSKAADLEEQIKALREQRDEVPPAVVEEAVEPKELLVGKWATTVSKSRVGRVELIFDLGEDGSVQWLSVHQQEFKTIAEGTWSLQNEDLHFNVVVVDQGNGDQGRERLAVARITELSESCLSLEVEGDDWDFHRTTT